MTVSLGLFVATVVAGAVPLYAANLLGLTDTGELFTSSDDGVTWAVTGTLPVSDAQAIAGGETASELFLASQAGVVYRSTDAGVSWSAVGTVAASDIVDMAIRTNGDVYLLSRAGTLWLSNDNGATFNAMATLTASNHTSLTGDAGGGNMYALTRTGEVAKSADYGTTWNVVGTIATSEAVEIRSISQDLYVMTESGDVWKSSDGGASWLAVGTVSQVHMTGLTIHTTGLVAVSREGLVATSGDATSWSFVGSINQLDVVAVGTDAPTITGIGPSTPPPATLRVRSLWPNPAGGGGNDRVTVVFDAPESAVVTARVYNVQGQLVLKTVVGAIGTASPQQFPIEVGALASGVYYLRLATATGERAYARLAVIR